MRLQKLFSFVVAMFTTTIVAAPPGQYCGKTIPLYGEGQRTSVSVQICIEVALKNSFVLKLSWEQWYRGGQWHHISVRNPIHWIISGSVDSAWEFSGKGVTHSPSSTNEVGILSSNIKGGKHVITMK